MTKKREAVETNQRSKGRQSGVLLSGDSVRVWGEVGITVAISDQPPQFVRVGFGHERISKSTVEEIRKTANKIDEFNEEELEKRLKKYLRLAHRVMEEDPDNPPTAKERARKRMRK